MAGPMFEMIAEDFHCTFDAFMVRQGFGPPLDFASFIGYDGPYRGLVYVREWCFVRTTLFFEDPYPPYPVCVDVGFVPAYSWSPNDLAQKEVYTFNHTEYGIRDEFEDWAELPGLLIEIRDRILAVEGPSLWTSPSVLCDKIFRDLLMTYNVEDYARRRADVAYERGDYEDADVLYRILDKHGTQRR